jgi:hypothetical protein
MHLGIKHNLFSIDYPILNLINTNSYKQNENFHDKIRLTLNESEVKYFLVPHD